MLLLVFLDSKGLNKMPQGRIVLKSICQSKKLSSLKTDGARLLYTWLIPNLDVNGCFSADPYVVNGQVLTRLHKSIETVKKYLADLSEKGLIIIYEANDDRFLNIPDFQDKQPSLNPTREGKTVIPPPTQDQLKSSSRVTPHKLSKVNISEVKGKEEEEKEENSSDSDLEKFTEKVIKKWQDKISPITIAESDRVAMEVSRALDLTNTDRVTEAELLEAIDNYAKARKVKNTFAGKFKLARFIQRLGTDGKCYLSAYFDIGNFGNKSKFETALEKIRSKDEQ